MAVLPVTILLRSWEALIKLRRLDPGLAPRRIDLHPRPVHVGFVVGGGKVIVKGTNFTPTTSAVLHQYNASNALL